jgi:hypothetical protein
MNLTPPPATASTPLAANTPGRQRRRAAGAVCLSLAAALASCGGGIFVGIDSSNDNPPDVALVVSSRAGFPGEPIELAAAASDDFAVRRVDFYLTDRGSVVFLASDFAPPYGLQTRVPVTPALDVSYLARAVDDVGQVTDSAWVVVQVLP